jgi:hypothetical protein
MAAAFLIAGVIQWLTGSLGSTPLAWLGHIPVAIALTSC